MAGPGDGRPEGARRLRRRDGGVRLGRRLRDGVAGQGDPARPRLLGPAARRAGRDPLGRLGDAAGARRPARVRARPAAARRADEPPRPAEREVVRGLPPVVPRRDPDHLPRPRLPRPGHHEDVRARAGQALRVSRQLLGVSSPEGAPARRASGVVRRPAEEAQADAGLRRPQPRERRDRRPAQSRLKAIEKMDRIDAPQTDNSTLRIKLPEPPRSGQVVAKLRDVGLRVWTEGRLRRPGPRLGARRSRRPGRPERGRQDDADEAADRHPPAPEGRGGAGGERRRRRISHSTASRRSTRRPA